MSIPAGWPQPLNFFGIPLVIGPALGQADQLHSPDFERTARDNTSGAAKGSAGRSDRPAAAETARDGLRMT
jgi:hypothetical protein